MDIETRAMADGDVGVDYAWQYQLQRLLEATPLATSLEEALEPLRPLLGEGELEILLAVIAGKGDEWRTLLQAPDGFALPDSYRLDLALAIHIYTLENPGVYRVVNREMFNPDRWQPGAEGGVSEALRACLPYIKMLDSALVALPEAYVFRDQVFRGVKFVYPSLQNHDPVWVRARPRAQACVHMPIRGAL
jgi:hypothetical protein